MKTLKLSHNLELNGRTISGRILGIEWNDNRRGDCESISNEKDDFHICSTIYPELIDQELYLWGDRKEADNDFISRIFPTKKRASEVYAFIQKHSVKKTDLKKEVKKKIR